MSGKTPISPAYRLELQYTVNSFTHKLHIFCEAVPTVLTDPVGFDTVPRSGFTSIGFSAAIDGVWAAIRDLFNSSATTFGQAILEHRVGSEYVPVGAWSTAITPSSSSPLVLASQQTDVLRDTNYEKVLVDLFETVFDVPRHYTTFASESGAVHDVSEAWGNTNAAATNASPYAWVKSRGGRYIDHWQSYTKALNRKLRRKRFVS